MGDAVPVLGGRTYDVHLNGEAFWHNVPAAVWDYRLGGYQVLKKWLSYRERKILAGTFGPTRFSTSPTRRAESVLWCYRYAAVHVSPPYSRAVWKRGDVRRQVI